MTAPARPDRWAALLTGAAVAALHTLRFGYCYGTGDHDDLLPPVLARLDPTLFPADPLVLRQLDGVTVRTAFEMLLTVLGHVVPLEIAVGALHVTVLAAVGAGVYALGRAFGVGPGGAALGSLLAGVAVPSWTLGGNAIVYSFLSPEGIAWALALPALVAARRDRFALSALWLGVATWLHALVGLTVGLALGLVLVAGWPEQGVRETARRGATLAVGFALVTGPFLLLALDAPSVSGAPLADGPSAFDLYVRLRFPHHLLPSAFPLSSWARFGLLASLGGLAWGVSSAPGRTFALRLLGVVALLGLVGFVGVEGLESFALARAQLFKLTVVANVVLCLGIGHVVAERVPDRVPALSLRAALPLALSGLAVAGVRVALAPSLPPEEAAAMDWIRTHTRTEAVVLAPPSVTTVRMQGGRAVVASWKAVPFQPDEGAAWWRRLLLLGPLPARPTVGARLDARLDSAYASHTPAGWRRLAEVTGASVALVDRTATPTPPEGAPAFVAGRWAVYRWPSEPEPVTAPPAGPQRMDRNVEGRPGETEAAPSGRPGSSGASAPSGPQ